MNAADLIDPQSNRPFRGSGPATPGGLDPAGSAGILAPEPQAPAAPAPPPEVEMLRKLGPDLQRRALEVLARYPFYDGADDARNRDYYKGEQWTPTTVVQVPGKQPGRPLAQNETFPVVDSLRSTLITDLPQVDFSDARQRSKATPPDRQTDLDITGRAIASVYNAFARLDDMEEALETAVLNSLIFNKGGIIQTSWDVSTGRPCWQALTPDEVFFDPVARRHRDIAWAFRLTQMHWDDFKERMESGTYNLDAVPQETWTIQGVEGENATQPPLLTNLPLSSINDPMLQFFRPGVALPQEMNRLFENPNQAADRRVYPDYVPMIEWYDCRRKICYHIHRTSGCIVGHFSMPISNPFRRLIPNPVPGEKDGVSVVSLIAAQQRVINELANGRLEVVRRIVIRLLLSKSLFQNDEDREKFLNSTTWEPAFVDPPEGGRPLSDHIGTTPAQPLSFDFNNHLGAAQDSMQKIAGSASYMRGVSENVRTAEEATMIRGAVENRLSKMNGKVVKFATELFEDARAYLKWAIANPSDSLLDVAALASISQADLTPAELTELLLSDTQQFQLAAFNPLMRDANTRRKMLVEGLPVILGNPVISQAFNLYELAREMAELFGLRLSTMNTPEEFKANLQAAMGGGAPAPAGAPGEPSPGGEAPMGDLPPLPPDGAPPPEPLPGGDEIAQLLFGEPPAPA